MFPAAEKDMVRAMLSESLVAVISQTLLKTKDGQGRIAAHEIMIGTPGDPQPDPREQGRADVLVDPDQPVGRHADARPVPGRAGPPQPDRRWPKRANRAVNKDLFGG